MGIEFIDLIQSCILSNSTCVTHILCGQRIEICYLPYTFDPNILNGTFLLKINAGCKNNRDGKI